MPIAISAEQRAMQASNRDWEQRAGGHAAGPGVAEQAAAEEAR